MFDFVQPYSDIIMMFCSIVFSISLIPVIYHNYRNKFCEIPYSTSFPTFFCMVLITVVYVSNGWILSSVTGLATMVCWLIILLQRGIYCESS
jgi:hypothetical protein